MNKEEFTYWLKEYRPEFELIGTASLIKEGVKVDNKDFDYLVRLDDLPHNNTKLLKEMAVELGEKTRYAWAFVVIKIDNYDFIICDDDVYETKLRAHQQVVAFARTGNYARTKLADKQFRYGFACANIFRETKKVY